MKLNYFVQALALLLAGVLSFSIPTPDSFLDLSSTKPVINLTQENAQNVEAGFVMTLTSKFF